MRAKRVDKQHTPIVTKLKAAGLRVHSLHKVGEGMPDIMVAALIKIRENFFLPTNLLFEIKNDQKAVDWCNREVASNKSDKEVSVQIQWHRWWTGQKQFVSSAEEIIEIVRKLREGEF